MNSGKFEQFVQELGALEQGRSSKIIDYGIGMGPEEICFEVSDGATPEQIQRAEETLGVVFPPSFRDFLLKWNGALLYKGEYRPGHKIFSTNETVERNRIWCEYELLPEEQVANVFLFADWGDGDYIAFDASRQDAAGEYVVLDGDHNFSPKDWKAICSNFEEWLTSLVEAEGRMFW